MRQNAAEESLVNFVFEKKKFIITCFVHVNCFACYSMSVNGPTKQSGPDQTFGRMSGDRGSAQYRSDGAGHK